MLITTVHHILDAFRFTHLRAFIYSIRHIYYRWTRAYAWNGTHLLAAAGSALLRHSILVLCLTNDNDKHNSADSALSERSLRGKKVGNRFKIWYCLLFSTCKFVLGHVRRKQNRKDERQVTYPYLPTSLYNVYLIWIVVEWGIWSGALHSGTIPLSSPIATRTV